MRSAVVGFIITAAAPITTGVSFIVGDIAYRASIPPAPNTAFCGMTMLAGWGLILVVGPACGTVGGAIGFVVSVVLKTTRKNS